MMAAVSIHEEHRLAGERAVSHVLADTPEIAAVPDTVALGFDAVAVDDLRDHARIDVRADVRRGDRIEFKSAVVRLSSGGRGRFNFRRKQHRRLQELGGKYALLVCEPNPDRRVLAGAIVEPGELDESAASWVELDVPDRAEEAFKQIRWGVLVDPSEVPREGPEADR